MVSRVSSFGQQQVLISSIMDNQSSLYESQRQVSTEKKYDDYQGLAGEASAVLGSKSSMARVETYQDTIKTVTGKLDANDVQISGVLEAVEGLADNLTTALANNQAEGLTDYLEQTFAFVSNALNTNYDGTYLFAGSATDTKPVNVTSLSDLYTAIDSSAYAGVGDAFDNSDTSFDAKIADGVNVNFGVLASDVGEGIFQEIYDIYAEIQTNGDIDGELSTTQFDFLKDQLASLNDTIDDVRQVQTKNGLVYERLEITSEQHADTLVFLEVFIGDMENVDLTEAITRLNNDELALEASYQALSSLNNLTLLNFL